MNTNIKDIDCHQTDQQAALRRRQLVELDSPWCVCKDYHGGIVSCRRCSRMFRPKSNFVFNPADVIHH